MQFIVDFYKKYMPSYCKIKTLKILQSLIEISSTPHFGRLTNMRKFIRETPYSTMVHGAFNGFDNMKVLLADATSHNLFFEAWWYRGAQERHFQVKEANPASTDQQGVITLPPRSEPLPTEEKINFLKYEIQPFTLSQFVTPTLLIDRNPSLDAAKFYIPNKSKTVSIPRPVSVREDIGALNVLQKLRTETGSTTITWTQKAEREITFFMNSLGPKFPLSRLIMIVQSLTDVHCGGFAGIEVLKHLTYPWNGEQKNIYASHLLDSDCLWAVRSYGQRSVTEVHIVSLKGHHERKRIGRR